MNAAEIAAYTTGVLMSRAAYRKDTKCMSCGIWLKFVGDHRRIRCPSCARFRSDSLAAMAHQKRKKSKP